LFYGGRELQSAPGLWEEFGAAGTIDDAPFAMFGPVGGVFTGHSVVVGNVKGEIEVVRGQAGFFTVAA